MTAMTLRIIDCKATPSSIKIFFSDAVNSDPSQPPNSALNPKNYALHRGANSVTVSDCSATIDYESFHHAVLITLNKPPFSPPLPPLAKGNLLGIVVSNVANASGSDGLPDGGQGSGGSDSSVTRVDGDRDDDGDARRTTRAVEDAVSYPVLTEDISFSAPTGRTSGGTPGGSGSAPLGQVATQAIGDVLGWKVRSDDAKGFAGALSAVFALKTVEGRTEVTWTPRTYAVQTDLSGGITGAQASLYLRAQGALDQALPLLDGLYALNPDVDTESITALKGVARSQLTELVNELAVPGGPRVERINQYFQLLLSTPGTKFPPTPLSAFTTDPDQIGGTLGTLRDQLGLRSTQDFVNTLADEQDLSNFRILSDYVTSLAQSWINNLPLFGLNTATPFFGTQLVLLSRQLSVVTESVDEVRFTLDSVFIGPAERQTLKLNFDGAHEPLFAEDLFNWIADFSTNEGPRLIQDGGKFGVQNSFLPIAKRLQHLVRQAEDPNPLNRHLPRGFHTSRVQRALSELAKELGDLVQLAAPISHTITENPTARDLNAIREQIALLTAEVTSGPSPANIVAFPPLLTFFQPQKVGTTSPPQSVTLFNSGAGPLTINSIQPGDRQPPKNAAADFTVIEPIAFPIILAPQATLAVLVKFKAGDRGSRTATLNVNTTPQATPTAALQIPLKGTGKP
jgi:hypothetical protein